MADPLRDIKQCYVNLLTHIADFLVVGSPEHENFVEQMKIHGVPNNIIADAKKNLRRGFDHLENRGLLSSGNFRTLRQMSEQSGNKGLLDFINKAEKEIERIQNQRRENSSSPGMTYVAGSANAASSSTDEEKSLQPKQHIQQHNWNPPMMQGPTKPRAGPTKPRARPTKSRSGPTKPRAGPTKSRSGPTKPRAGQTKSRVGLTQSAVGPKKPRAGSKKSRAAPRKRKAGPKKSRAGPTKRKPTAGPKKSRAGPTKARAGPRKSTARPRKSKGGAKKM